MKILISAYACEPERGSEPEVGLRTVLAAARHHDVWVLTRENNIEPLRGVLADYPHRDRVTIVGFDVPGRRLIRKKAWGRVGLYRYYDQWQQEAARVAARLDRTVDFDVIHHATFATFWARAGIAWLDKPLVWGPVGGGVETAPSLRRELGVAGLATDGARYVSRRLLARLPRARRAPDRAAVTFVQNQETARLARPAGASIILSNATAIDVEVPPLGQRSGDVVFAGSLTALKGPRLAVRALRHVSHTDCRLYIYGEGRERRRILAAASHWGLADRVVLAGMVSRQEVLTRIAGAGVLLHPALHDEAGLVVAEALSFGTPVVCLDHGGPAEVARRFPSAPSALIRPGGPDATAHRLADAIDRFLDDPAPIPTTVFHSDPAYEDEILAAYDRAAAAGD